MAKNTLIEGGREPGSAPGIVPWSSWLALVVPTIAFVVQELASVSVGTVACERGGAASARGFLVGSALVCLALSTGATWLGYRGWSAKSGAPDLAPNADASEMVTLVAFVLAVVLTFGVFLGTWPAFAIADPCEGRR